MISHRVGTRLHPRLRWFHFGNAGAGMQLTTLCSNRRPYSFISFQGAAAQIVAALWGIRPESPLAVNFPSAGRWLDPGVEGRPFPIRPSFCSEWFPSTKWPSENPALRFLRGGNNAALLFNLDPATRCLKRKCQTALLREI